MAMGGDVYIDLSRFVQFRTGLNFHSVTLKHRDFSPLFPADVINGQAQIYKSFWDFNTAYTFVGLPLQIKMKANDKANHIFISGGLELEQKLYSSGSIELTESGVSGYFYKPEDLPLQIVSTQMFVTGGFGFEWSGLKSKISLGPMVEYSISKNFKTQAGALKNGHLLLFGIRFAYN